MCYLNLVLLISGMLLLSCGKSDSPPTPPPSVPLTISGIVPDSAAYNEQVTIQGSGFSTTITEDIVKINDKQVPVVSATSTGIVVTISKGSGSGPVKLTVNGKTTTGPQFTYKPTYTVTTIAGSVNGFADGQGLNAQFYYPDGLIIDAQDNIYVADLHNNLIRKITATGMVSTFTGSTAGYHNADLATSLFFGPTDLAFDSQKNLYVAEFGNSTVRKITPAGLVSTFADTLNGTLEAIAIDIHDNVYTVEENSNLIRKITPDGTITDFAGSVQGFAEGTGTNAKFSLPSGIATDAQGNIYVSDSHNNAIRKITPDGIVTTIAGGTQGLADGIGGNAKFYYPGGIIVDSANNLYVADTYNSCVRKVTPSGQVSTIAGPGLSGTAATNDGPGKLAGFAWPTGIAMDSKGNLIVSDFASSRIRKITIE